MSVLGVSLIRLLDVISFIIVIQCVLSWIPSVRMSRIYEALSVITDPIEEPIRRVQYRYVSIPVDFSPLIAILLEDGKALGKKGAIVNVSDGYARNMILPKKLGVEATPKNLNDLKLQKANAEKVAQENLESAQAFAKDLETKEIILTLKVGEGGRTFGSVSSKEISEAAKVQLGLDIDKKKLQLPSPIRNLGVTQVPVKLHPKVTGSLKVWIKEA